MLNVFTTFSIRSASQDDLMVFFSQH